ncbi:MAG TPA: EVE domain-containing protein [Candidatus Eisenbacteria bacterium]|nr:EVE domain-containing protein [Candidatus Eisenbacteria bacterium]
MATWILKTEPETYSWDDLVREKKARWDGVRNFAAAKNLRAMKVGDEALIYHSGDAKAVVGIAKVVRAAYPDPTAEEGDWVAVDLAPVKPLQHPVTLAEMKKDKALAGMVMVRQGRLSVSPVKPEERKRLIK